MKINNIGNRYSAFHPFTYDLYTPISKAVDFTNKKVLDFGGSFGNLIISSQGKIKEENYTCLDLDKSALETGKSKFPNSTWLHHDVYNKMYGRNNTGCFSTELKKYDVIFAFSVFTHMPYDDMIETLDKLKSHLNKGGKIYISVCVQQDKDLMEWYKNRRAQEFGYCEDYKLNNSYIYFVDNKQESSFDKDGKYFLTFYDKDFIKQIGNIVDVDIFQTLIEVY